MNRRIRPNPAGESVLSELPNPDSFALADARLGAQRPLRKPRLQHIAAYLQNDRIELARNELTKYLAKNPDDTDAIGLLARTAVRLGHPGEAVSLLARCLELAPDFAAARYNRAALLLQRGEFRAALGEADRLLSGDGGNPLFRQLKANILAMLGEYGQALEIFARLADENPKHAGCWLGYGDALRAMGFQEKSIAAYRTAIACRPSFGLGWWALADMKTVRFDEADITAMQEALKRPDLTADNRILLQFALGKAYEDLRDFQKSFAQYAKANAVLRLRTNFDLESVTVRVTANKALFTPEFLQSRSDGGCKKPDPIFILGLPRSGSTLLEQILSSHSAIEGTAELPYIEAIAARLEGREGPEALRKLEPSALAALGEEYLEKARAHRKLGRPFFIDKKPRNFLHVGLIHLILPKAKIIDARRHPAACCFSMFKSFHSNTHPRLAELGRYYCDNVALMAHFDRVLPGRIHRVIYESLVSDPEGEIRRLFAYLGLPFEERCLRFHETDRAVRTPSSEQVRQPISGAAVEHWRHYEPWLGALIKSLGSVMAAYPSVPEDLG
ncbi:MAG TPA: sulfotransferase [Rhizomicrobium sp.]